MLKVDWDDSGFEHHSTGQLYTKMNESFKSDGLSQKTQGNFLYAFDKSEKKLESVYETPYESHSCMEPINCIAHVHDDKCEIWGPIQGPDWIQQDLSQRLGLKMENVTVNMTFLGGGFGHFYAYAPTRIEYAIDRFAMEVKRQMDVLDRRLGESTYVAGDDYTIADMAIWPWYGALAKGQLYEAGEFLQVSEYTHVIRWAAEIAKRPAARRGRMVNRVTGRLEAQLHERHDASDFDTRTQDKLQAQS